MILILAVVFAIARRRAQATEALREQARRDPLTGALNHAAIVGELRQLLDGEGDRVPCAVAMVDVDGMKATNDTFGHQVGDAVLVAVAGALSEDGAKLGRYGGDEFVAIIKGADRAAAERHLREAVERLAQTRPVDPESGLTVPASVSIGLAVYPEEAQTVTDLIKLSDNAMYASRLRRPQPPNATGTPRRREEQAAKMVGEMVPLLTSEGSLNDKLRLVAHRLWVGAGYDGVNFELLVPGRSDLLAASSSAHVSDEETEAWGRHKRHRGPHSLTPILQRTLRPVMIMDTQHDQRLAEVERDLLAATGFRSLLVAPMLWHDELAGTLSVLSKKEAAFGPRDAQFVTAVATQVAAIVHMAMLLEELQSASDCLSQAREETVLLLAAAAEARDRTTGLHLQGVRTLAEALARELGHSEEEARELGLASILHDIGKIFVPDSVLRSPAPLSKDQWELMKRHTTRGSEFFSGRPGFELAATIALRHHERWDGAGYPHGLACEAIPEAATIVAVADAFDAMTHERPYSPRRSAAQALQEVRSHAGTQFSPRVVAALEHLYQRNALPLTQAQEKAAA